MKTFLFATLLAVFVMAGTGRSLAHYQHDDHGWYDEHNHRHDFITYNNHRGYWDHNDKGVKVFIRI